MPLYKKITIIAAGMLAAAVVSLSLSLSLSGSPFVSNAAPTDYEQFKSDDIAHGWDGTCPWSIDKDGTLTLWEGTPVTTKGEIPSGMGVNVLNSEQYQALTTEKKKEFDYIATDDLYWQYGMKGYGGPWHDDHRESITSAVVKDGVQLKDASALFLGLKNMKTIELPQDLSSCTNFKALFDGCLALESIDLRGRKANSVTDMRYMFRNCTNLQWCYLNDMDTSKVTCMRYMFQSCMSLKNVDVSNFDTTSVNNIAGMFDGCINMVSVDISSFTLPSGTNNEVGWIFSRCSSIQRVNFGKNTLKNNEHLFAPAIPTTAPYTGKWVCEERPSIVLTTQQLVANYPNATAPEGTYVWQTTSAVISFDANGGTTSEPFIVQNGTSTEINLPSGEDTTFRDGYQLVSWNTERDGSGTHYYPGQKIAPQQGKNMILYAQWVSLSELSPLKYVIEGYDTPDRNGIYDDPASKNYQGYHRIGSDVVLTSLCPQRAAHVFLGWSTEQISDIAYLDDDAAAAFLASDKHVTQVTMPADGMIVYAVWQEKYSRKILNGDFEYPSIPFKPGGNGVGHQNGIFNMENGTHSWGNGIEKIPNFEKKRFAWHSTQTIDASPLLIGPGDVEIQQECCTTNRYGEIVGEQENTSIYQDILTTPKALYKWSLKHCSRSNELVTNETGCNDHAMNVLIGTPSDDGEPQSAYRTSTNGSDPIGSVGTIVQTHNRFGHDYSKEWETYEGAYIVPDGQYVTRFSFHSLISGSPTSGNLVDDISFSQAYPLYYDMNDEDSIVKADRNGIYTDDDIALNGYQGYVNEGADNPLTTIVPTRYGYNFLGWSLSPLSPVAKGEEESVSDELVGSVNPTGETRVYAVWQENSAPLTYVIEGYDDLDRNGIYDDPSANDQQGYHEIGSNVTLTNMKPSRAAHEFLGWSSESMDDIAYLDDDAAKAFLGSDKHITEITMPQEGMSVYAVWQEKYSRKIINGDFEYPADSKIMSVGSAQTVWTYINPFKETAGSNTTMTKIPLSQLGIDFNRKYFAWASTQNQKNYPFDEDGDVEIRFQRDANYQHYADLIPSQSYASIYQDIITIPGTICKWRLSHCSSVNLHVDTMSVVVGKPGEEGAVLPATRITSNGSGEIGETSDIIGTKVTNSHEADHAGQWEDYAGTYVVPENQYVTRFSFKSVEGYVNNCTGNYVDNISFSLAYPLTFDVNGGTNNSIYTDPTANNYQGYHQEGESVTLPTSPDALSAPEGDTFLGWSEEKFSSIDETTSDEEKILICDSVIRSATYDMPAEEKILYAVYAKTASIDTSCNEGGSVTVEKTESSDILLPSFEIDVTPDAGYIITEILVDGEPVSGFLPVEGEPFTFTIEDVVGKHTVSVMFKDVQVWMAETGSNGLTIFTIVMTVLVLVIGVCASVYSIRKRNGKAGSWQLR